MKIRPILRGLFWLLLILAVSSPVWVAVGLTLNQALREAHRRALIRENLNQFEKAIRQYQQKEGAADTQMLDEQAADR